MSDVAQSQVSHGHDGETRRDFLTLTASALGVVGLAAAIWPFVDSLNPAKDTLALSTTDVDLSPVQLGQRLGARPQVAALPAGHRHGRGVE